MRCPLADTHDYVPVTDPELGEVLVCRDCDDVAVPLGVGVPVDEPASVLLLTGGW